MSVVLYGKSALWFWRSVVGKPALLDHGEALATLRKGRGERNELNEMFDSLDACLGLHWHGASILDIAGTSACGMRGGAYLHRYGLAEMDRLFAVPGCECAFVFGPETALRQVSETWGVERTLLLALELCGTFRMSADLARNMVVGTRPCLEADRVRSYVQECGDKRPRVLASVSEILADGCASVMEAKLFCIMCLPPKFGGFGLPVPLVNPRIELTESARVMFGRRTLTPDYAWPDRGVLLEYDSNAWHDGVSNPSSPVVDNNRKDAFTSMGYSVRTLTTGKLYSYDKLTEFMCSMRTSLQIPRRARELDRVSISRRRRLCSIILFMQDAMGDIYDSRRFADRLPDRAVVG